jgi:hypothetical protein
MGVVILRVIKHPRGMLGITIHAFNTLYSVSPKKYPYNNRIISMEGTFLGDTLYKLKKPEPFQIQISYNVL